MDARNEIHLSNLVNISAQERRARILLFIEECVRSMLHAAGPLPISRKKPLREMGVDSFMAVRLRHTLQEASGDRLPTSILFNYSTIEALAEHLTVRWASARPAMATVPGSAIIARLKDMSEDEAQAFLAAVKP